MKTIKQTVLILLIVLILANAGTYFYLDTLDRDVAPKIQCPDGVLEISASDSEDVLLEGITAYDEQDGDLTDRITIGGISKLITKDTAKVTYFVFDSDNNVASSVRRIRYVDYQRPTFEVIEPLVYASTEEVSMLSRLKATDVVDGDISKNIRLATLESTKNSEIFHIAVQVSNSLGDTTQITLPVLIMESNPLRPELLLSNPLIYLEKGAQFTPSAYLVSLQVPGMKPSWSDVTIDNEVDTEKPGTYYVTYTYSANGSTGIAVLTVVVE